MKKLVITLSLLIGITANSIAYDFSAVCESGQTLYYTILNNQSNRVIVDRGDEIDISGDVIVPLTVEHNGTVYTVYGIGEHAFIGDTLLNSIVLSDSIRYIQDGAFFKCSNLRHTSLGANIQSIGNSVFSRCSKLESIDFSDALFSIGNRAFSNCAFQSISIPNSVVEMGEAVFSNCSSLREIILPDSLSWGITTSMFENCTNLQNVELPNFVSEIGSHAFENCSSLESIELSTMIDGIGSYAFSGCSSLTEVNLLLGSGAIVGSSAFYNCCNLKRLFIDVPYSYGDVYLESNAFKGTGLESITIKCQKKPNITQNTFEGVSKTIPVVVPCGLASQYEEDGAWSEFTNIQEDLLYTYNIVTDYEGKGTVQVFHEPTSCEDGLIEVLAIPQDGYTFIYWYISDYGFISVSNPLSIEPFVDGPIMAVFDATGVDENNIAIDVYPNPTDGIICIGIEGVERIEVYSINGQFIKEFNSSEIDITELNAGNYLLKVFTSSGWVTKQIIKK